MAFSAERAFAYLERSHREGRLGHAYLITGADAPSQEALALRLIGLLTGEEPSGFDEAVSWGACVVKPQSKSRRIKTAEIRMLERGLHLGGSGGGRKVGVVTEADRLQPEAANAFLKTLEEPPPGTLLLLLTLEPERLLPTVLSRCIRVSLTGAAAGAPKAADEQGLLDLLDSHYGSRAGIEGSAGAALAFKGAFAALLAGVKAKISAVHEADFKEEVARYKKSTEGDWLNRREEASKAAAESQYLQRRAVLIGALAGWFGDALRQRLGLRLSLDHPGFANATAELGRVLDERALVERVAGVEFLRSHLETNVSEALALEVGFLRILSW